MAACLRLFSPDAKRSMGNSIPARFAHSCAHFSIHPRLSKFERPMFNHRSLVQQATYLPVVDERIVIELPLHHEALPLPMDVSCAQHEEPLPATFRRHTQPLQS